MRENIGLFKAKDINTKEWREGYYWTNELGNHFIRVVRNKDNNFINPIDYEIDPETLCECTGVKDKNGKLIFENYYIKQDIEKQGYSNGQPNDDLSFFGLFYGVVKFTPSTGFYIKILSVEDEITGERKKVNWKTKKRIVSYRTEVIGNKFDK